MIDVALRPASVDVQDAEYVRLLGYPRGHVLEGRALELADWARDWYRAHGRPWTFTHPVPAVDTEGAAVRIGGTSFTSTTLSRTLRDAGADAAVLVAVSAGAELEAEAQRRWLEGKPDEYFFLEIYGSAVVEHLVTTTGARLCAEAEGHGQAVLPHYSPGYPDWDVSEQPDLLRLIQRAGANGHPLPLEAFESGMLRPKKSLLAIFGVTRHVDRVRHLAGLNPCENCSFSSCQYRRAPYRRASRAGSAELALVQAAEPGMNGDDEPAASVPASPLSTRAKYSVNERALRRWATERLTVVRGNDGSVDATFRFEGTTCTNMGRPMEFHYEVRLGPPALGYPILEERCMPAPGDQGHKLMCAYLDNPDRLMKSLGDERPLAGEPLEAVLDWRRAQASSGCYCDGDSRTHKWGLVLETLHFALARGVPPHADGGGPSSKETVS